jgi:hypothetical protein
MNIGSWVKRRGSKWHLVESVVAGAAITRCGRRMEERTSEGELEVSSLMPLTRMIGQPQLCKAGCQDTEPAGAGEDDASTQPEMVP